MVVFLLLAFAGCHSAVQLDSVPAGAKVYKEDGDLVCATPCEVGSRMPFFVGSMTLNVEKDGYQGKTISVPRNDFYLARLLFPLTIPWMFGLKPNEVVELVPFSALLPGEAGAAKAQPLRPGQ